ncbi:phage tail protein [Baaleninema sp.]|uniref:phage tail protein n=1 Tax=Baaleninema sp. TaxID=3101197 RepID=UPI003CFC0FE0
MTLTQSQPTVSLKLHPQQLPRRQSDSPLRVRDDLATPESAALVLEPGEFRSIVVELRHSWRSPLNLELVLEHPTDLPSGCFRGWHESDNPYQLGLDEEVQPSLEHRYSFPSLPPEETQRRVLFFYLPEDFFESEAAITGSRPRLTLEYPLQLRVYASLPHSNRRQLANFAAFGLQIRPQSLYLNLLPNIYQANDFLERFLKILEEAFDPTVRTSEMMWAYLDPLVAPKALLPFLAHWVGWKLDPRLSELQNRHLIRHAVNLYRWHGTRAGLRLYLHLYTGLPLSDRAIEIQEVFDRGFRLGETELGLDSTLGAGQAYHFTVVLRPSEDLEIDEPLVREVIERYKPAFCTYSLQIFPENS